MNEQTATTPAADRRVSTTDNMPPLPALISTAAEAGDFAVAVTEWLNDRYGTTFAVTGELLDECAALMRDPATGEMLDIVDDEMKASVTSLIKRLRDHAKQLDGIHEKEKTAYYRGGQAVDQRLFSDRDRLARRDKKARPGAADVLGQKLTEYDTRKLAEEQARRRAEAEKAEREAREAREAQEKAEREAEEARQAADRARNPERIEEKREVADKHEAAIAPASASVQVAETRAAEAKVQSFAKPADIMRQRGSDGTLSTMATEKYAEIVPGQDAMLNKELLWPFIKLEAKEQALRAWAKNTGYTQQMDGALIGSRPKSVVR